MAQSIFSAPAGAQNKPLVEFRAGKMQIRGNLVQPDKRKGLIQLVQSPDDNLIHLRWKDRGTGLVETDLIIFPEEATFKRVKQCTTGRVYLLEWKATARRLFFWMQEPSEDKDAENATNINKFINNPPAAGEETAPAGGGGLDQAQIMQMMRQGRGGHAARGAAGGLPHAPAPAAPAAASGGAGADAITGDHLQNILRGLGVAPTTPAAQPTTPPQQAPAQRRGPNLASIMTPEALLPLLNNPLIQQELFQHLPEGDRSPERLLQLLRTPQFQQALSAFQSAIEEGHLGDILPHLGLPASSVGTNASATEALLQALAQQSQQASGSQQPPAQEEEQQKKREEDQGDKKDDSGGRDSS